MATAKVFKLEITMENDAFGPTDEIRRDELSRILCRTAQRIVDGGTLDDTPLFDVNGNCVGHTKVITRRET